MIHLFEKRQTYFCNITVKDPVTFHIPVTYEIFISDIVLLVNK